MMSIRFALAGAERAAARSSRSKSDVSPLEEATLPEVVQEARKGYGHDGDDDPEADERLLARHVHVHAPDRRDERQRQQDHAERRQHPEGLVASMGEDGLVGVLERLDDLLEVLEHVPDPLPRIVDVVEVDVEVVRDVARLVALEVAEGRPLRADDLAEVDDLLLDVGEVADDVLGAALEDVLLDAVELVAHLAQHRERRVHARVDDAVEQVARPLAEVLVALLLVGAAALEEALDGPQRLAGERDDVVGPDEDVELGGVQPADALVERREVQDDEQVVVVLVDLRALVAREDVLVVERVEHEALLQPCLVGRARALDVDPPQTRRVDDLDAGLLGPWIVELRLRGGAQTATDARLRETRHGDSKARPASAASPGSLLIQLQTQSHQEGWRDWPDEAPPT